MRYVRRYGYPDDFDHENTVFHLLRPISKRRAKKKNPRLVKMIGNSQSYFTCKEFSGSGCRSYATRPAMCSGYPLYGRADVDDEPPIYHKDCTYFVSL